MVAKRNVLIAGNWKMNGLRRDVRSLAGGLARKVETLKRPNLEMLICPPFPLLSLASETIKGSGIKLGAQDCHMNVAGAHTGDVSAELLKNNRSAGRDEIRAYISGNYCRCTGYQAIVDSIEVVNQQRTRGPS